MSEIIKCQKCGNEIGEIMIVNELELLRIGSWAFRNVDAVCLQCGATFNWHYPDRMLQRIINRHNSDE